MLTDAPARISHIVTPGSVRLPLSEDDYLVVKQRLTAGETLDLFERAAPGLDITQGFTMAHLSPTKVGMALMLAYILDWNLVDPDGAPLDIRHASDDEKTSIFRQLTFEKFTEVMTAVGQHDTARRQEKKRPPSGNGS